MCPDPAPAVACRNCGANVTGDYCAACGQETQVKLPTARVFLREAMGRYVALDGRLWRTLAALMFRPGFLTREYIVGRRRRYIRPARLFLVLSLALFAAPTTSMPCSPAIRSQTARRTDYSSSAIRTREPRPRTMASAGSS